MMVYISVPGAHKNQWYIHTNIHIYQQRNTQINNKQNTQTNKQIEAGKVETRLQEPGNKDLASSWSQHA